MLQRSGLASGVWMVFVMWQNAVVVCWLYVYMSHFMYQIESGWVGICRGVGRVIQVLCWRWGAEGRCRWVLLGRCLSGV
jgi:hypothetical protein